MSINSTEEAYVAIAAELLDWVGENEWEMAKSFWEVYPSSTGTRWARYFKGHKFEKGTFPLDDLSDRANEAVRFLRDNLLQTTGALIWGLTFTLYPNQKIRIEYDYNVPEGYDGNGNEIEEREPLSLDDAVSSLRNKGIDVEVNDPKAQDKG